MSAATRFSHRKNDDGERKGGSIAVVDEKVARLPRVGIEERENRIYSRGKENIYYVFYDACPVKGF